MEKKLTMLGTGGALATKCYNTCFTLSVDNDILLVDAGGGNGILSQIEKAGIDYNHIHNMFVTHAHTDHVMGVVWIVRMIAQRMLKDSYAGTFTIYCHSGVAKVITTFCEMTLAQKHLKYVGNRIIISVVEDADMVNTDTMQLTFFDIASTKLKQFGVKILLPDHTSVVCLGDEPFNEQCRQYVQGADWLLSEAFCLYADKEKFQPYEKHHSTALDAARAAQTLAVKHLILYHTEDITLDTRATTYANEARKEFSGDVIVPNDLDVITL